MSYLSLISRKIWVTVKEAIFGRFAARLTWADKTISAHVCCYIGRILSRANRWSVYCRDRGWGWGGEDGCARGNKIVQRGGEDMCKVCKTALQFIKVPPVQFIASGFLQASTPPQISKYPPGWNYPSRRGRWEKEVLTWACCLCQRQNCSVPYLFRKVLSKNSCNNCGQLLESGDCDLCQKGAISLENCSHHGPSNLGGKRQQKKSERKKIKTTQMGWEAVNLSICKSGARPNAVTVKSSMHPNFNFSI